MNPPLPSAHSLPKSNIISRYSETFLKFVYTLKGSTDPRVRAPALKCHLASGIMISPDSMIQGTYADSNISLSPSISQLNVKGIPSTKDSLVSKHHVCS